MTEFKRGRHLRTNQYGNTHWVREHSVSRDDFSHNVSQIRAFADHVAAKSFLKSHKAEKARTSCLIVPNAHCPVCDAHVFFYSNLFGSRVYFDDLGPPWPKHPCTDNPKTNSNTSISKMQKFEIRTKGLRQELFAAESLVKNTKHREYGERRGYEWTPIVILSVNRTGNKNTIEAEYIEAITKQILTFTCYSSDILFEAGDIISVKGNDLSFVHPSALIPIIFKNGSDLDEVKESLLIENTNKSVSSINKSDPQFGDKKTETRLIRDFLPSELEHFHYRVNTFDKMYAKIGPVVTKLLSEGIHDPSIISNQLNAARLRSAKGAKWTPRLARFLVNIVENIKKHDLTTINDAVSHPSPSQKPKKKKLRMTAYLLDKLVRPASQRLNEN